MPKTFRPLSIGILLTVLFPAAAALAQGTAPPPPDEEPLPPSFPRTPAPGAGAGAGVGVGADATLSAAPAPQRPAPVIATAPPDSYLPTLAGPLGLYRVSTAEVGPENHLRLALHGEYFRDSGFLVEGDTNSRMNGELSFGYTPLPYLEIFGAILTSSNRNHRTNSWEPPRRDPELIKSFGDLVLGPKGVLPIARGQTVAFELGFRFLSSISDLSISPSSTSLWIGPRYTVDLRKLANTPLRFHASADFYLDNSKNLVDFSDTSITIYTREVATFAYGIAASRMRFALAIDAPLEKLTAPVPLTPFAEYHAEIVTAGKDPAFKDHMNPNNRDQQWLTGGLRARVYRGITLDAGVDVRLRSVGYEFGPPLPPWNFLFGGAFPLDIDAFTKPVVVTRTIERNVASGPPAALEGQVAGVVKSSRDGKPVAGALVAVAKRPLSRVATDPDGAFQTVMLPPGPVELEVTAPGFETSKVNAAVILGRSQRVDVTLTAKTLTGNVRGKVTDAKGHPLQAALRLAGTEVFSAQADSSGQFSASLPVGPYRVTAEMPKMPPKEVSLDIVEGVDRQLDIVMREPNTNVTLSGDTISLKQPIKLKAGPAAKLDVKTQATLDGVAELLQDHPEIRTLRIETWWDNSAGKNAQTVTDNQAKAIKDYLVKKGTPEGRIEAVGHGDANPLVPNIGPVNKAKNRRVELHVVQ